MLSFFFVICLYVFIIICFSEDGFNASYLALDSNA